MVAYARIAVDWYLDKRFRINKIVNNWKKKKQTSESRLHGPSYNICYSSASIDTFFSPSLFHIDPFKPHREQHFAAYIDQGCEGCGYGSADDIYHYHLPLSW